MSSTETPSTTPISTPPTLWDRIRKFRLPGGQSLVWSLIALERGFLRQVIVIILFLLSFRFIFAWSWSLSAAMLISMFLHECGHASVFALARIRFIILFLFPLGAVAAPINKEEDARSDTLHWNTISWLLQAGPAVNVVLMIAGVAIEPLFTDPLGVPAQFARDVVYVNGLLAIMNLVPVWTLDAGQLFKVIYNSLEEHEERWITGLIIGFVILLLLLIIGVPGMVEWQLILVNIIQRFGWIVFLLFFTFGILNKQAHDDPKNATSHQAMSSAQVFVQLAVYFVLVGLTLWIFAGALV